MKYFKLLSYVEGTSLLALLLIAMPLKYWGGMPEAVRVVGMVHGILFLIFVYASVNWGLQWGWSLGRIFISWIIASIPLGPVLFEKRLFASVETVTAGGTPESR